jgi:hypothetical protein
MTKINHVIATALLEIEIANGNHNQPRDEVNDKAGNDWIVECQKWCGCTHRVCSVLESEESSLHDPREHIEEYRRLFCSAPNPFYSAAAYYGDKAKSSGIAPGGFAV